MPLKRERIDPETSRSMSPIEQPTPPDSPRTPAISTPSNFGLDALYRTPIQPIVELREEETIDSDSSMEEGQVFEDTRQSTPDSMDIGIPCVPSDWLQPDSP